MTFFNDYQKILAQRYNKIELKRKYKESEKLLNKASKTGSETLLVKAMDCHRDFEYALLYQNTPEFKYKYDKRSKIAK